MRISHIYWFAHYNLDGPCVRYRGKYLLDQLKRDYGIPFSFVVPGYRLQNILHFLITYFSALLFRKKNSLIVFQKIYTLGIYANALKVLLFFRRYKTFYDIDDAYYLKFPAETIHHFLKKTGVIITGSQELMDYVEKFNPNVVMISSPVIRHNLIKQEKNALYTIGWIGFYNAHRQNMMDLFFPALFDLDFEMKLVLLGVTKSVHRAELKAMFSKYPKIKLEMPENINWLEEEAVYQLISQFDIGIAPLIDNEMNRAKSAFKLKQYLSCAVPVLGSRTGENSSVIKEGENGYFCDSPDEFKSRILEFKEMPAEFYEEFCKNAKRSVKPFMMVEYCKKFIEIVDGQYK
ncbi:MAG: glycosyltransferase [Bacteroidota bacterium]